MLRLILLSFATTGVAAASAQDPLRETQVSAPDVVRTEYDMREVVRPPALSADELAGWKLFVQRCAICHDPLGQPSFREASEPLLNEATVRELGVATVRDVIRVGSVRMPGLAIHAVAGADRPGHRLLEHRAAGVVRRAHRAASPARWSHVGRDAPASAITRMDGGSAMLAPRQMVLWTIVTAGTCIRCWAARFRRQRNRLGRRRSPGR